MIIGDGDIASVIPDRADRTYFASGVSNSQEDREYRYKMEADLLLSQDRDRRLVYFSSLCIFYSHTRYSQHKLYMEDLIRNNFTKYCILRLGNITWGDNPNTIINYFKNHKDFEIRDEYRYLVDKDEFIYWLSMIPDFNCEMNVPGKRMKVTEIVKEYV